MAVDCAASAARPAPEPADRVIPSESADGASVPDAAATGFARAGFASTESAYGASALTTSPLGLRLDAGPGWRLPDFGPGARFFFGTGSHAMRGPLLEARTRWTRIKQRRVPSGGHPSSVHHGPAPGQPRCLQCSRSVAPPRRSAFGRTVGCVSSFGKAQTRSPRGPGARATAVANRAVLPGRQGAPSGALARRGFRSPREARLRRPACRGLGSDGRPAEALRRHAHASQAPGGFEAQGSIGQRPGGNAGPAQRTFWWSKALRSRGSRAMSSRGNTAGRRASASTA